MLWDGMTCKNAQLCNTSQTCLEPHACACDGQRCATLTTLRKMCVRRGVLSSLTVTCTTFSDVCTRHLKKKKNIYMALKESVAITVSTNVDLAIEYLGVCVATIVVKMMKRKFATSGISNFGCAIPGLLAMLHWMVFGALSRSSWCRRFVVLVLVEELWDCAWWTWNLLALASVQLAYHYWIPVRCCSRTGSAGAMVRCRRCHNVSEILYIFRHLAIWAWWIYDCSFLLLFGHPLLSNGLFVIEFRRVSYLFSTSLVQGNKELS